MPGSSARAPKNRPIRSVLCGWTAFLLGVAVLSPIVTSVLAVFTHPMAVALAVQATTPLLRSRLVAAPSTPY